ncbi:MAG TPA: hypothetical protein VEZ11_02640 [Thermoanaerobaculia bacterium]|nr:hypothetical protein [Thermoanaerobaculia bacterium]
MNEMRALTTFVLIAFGFAASGHGAATTMLSQRSLQEELTRLRNPSNKADYEVAGPVRITGNETWYLGTLKFRRGGQLILGSSSLNLYVRERLVSDAPGGNAGFFAYTTDATAESGISGGPGESGGAGANGANSGDLTLHLAKEIEGTITIDLRGQQGGRGGDGGAGVRGAAGVRGEDARSSVLGCAHGGGNGSPGGPGGNGGDGGAGGNCGAIGELRVYLPMAKLREMSKAAIRFVTAGRPGSSGGNGGRPGEGGAGGAGGSGGGFCSGGQPGPAGNPGKPGRAGTPGSECGQPTQIIDVEPSPARMRRK